MVKKFTIPFASQGDANDIPDALQVDGKVSFTQGFGYDYERPYDDPQSKDIAREDMNGLFKAITSAVGELQTLGASEWSDAISYPKGAIVYHEKDLYISQVDDNQNTPPQSWVSITSIANDSLKKVANLSDLTNKTTARNNLGLGSSATLNKTDVLGTSTGLVATQKLVNDTKINLENSKQDKLTFVGSGPEVMKKGAYGVGQGLSWSSGETFDSFGKKYRGLVSAYNGIGVPSDSPSGGAKKLLQFGHGGVWETQILSDAYANNLWVRTRKSSEGVYSDWDRIALIKDIPTVSQYTGSSTTNVMSQKAVTDESSKNTPIGTVQAFIGENAPNDKWLLCRGQAFSATTYPGLAQLLPDLKIPDLRGVALRGLDANRGFDPNRELLSYQEDAMQKITGEISRVVTNPSNTSGDIKGAFVGIGNGGGTNIKAETSDHASWNIYLDSSGVTRSNTQDETVMKNVAVNFIIKAR